MKKKFGAKAEFVRSQPVDVPAAEVVRAAAAAGIKVTVNHVYNVRAALKKQGAVAPRLDGPKVRAIRAEFDSVLAEGAILYGERELRKAIAELGLARSRVVLAEVERAFGSV